MTTPKAWKYLTSRGISLGTAKHLRIGYFGESNFSLHSQRVLFPIHSAFGDLLGFQGRALFDWQYEGKPKYWHDPFTKANHLYGLYENCESIVRMGYTVIVESPFCVAALWECGIPAVATLGTAFSETHAYLLRQHTDFAFEWLDNDGAGRAGAEKAANILKAWGIKSRSLAFADQDASTTLVAKGKESIIRRIVF